MPTMHHQGHLDSLNRIKEVLTVVYDQMIFGEKINHIAWHICHGEVGIKYFLILCLFYLHLYKKPLFCAMLHLAGVLAH